MASFNQDNRTKCSNSKLSITRDCSNCDEKKIDVDNHENQMKKLYGKYWYWNVENTENDCEIANKYREWFYKKGVTPDFNINNHEEIKQYEVFGEEDLAKEEDLETDEELLREIENSKAWENSEEKAKEDKERYILLMNDIYGDEWYWIVRNTEHDSEIADQYREWYCQHIDQYFEEE